MNRVLQQWLGTESGYRVFGSAAVGIAISGAVTAGGALLPSCPVIAQIVPDATLGNEPSIVRPDQTVRGLPATLIQGGALRGRNLFQSFQDFNIGEGQRVYFANPAGVEAILSRVTGNNPSRLMGLLGVDGSANLFFMNPNGIIFGNNARLDIAGSFVATTAERLTFENGATFSARNPEAPPLLTVSLRPHLPYATQYQGDITHAGQLTVGTGQTLALQGKTVTSRGSLTAPGGTVQVLGDRIALLDPAQIDVSNVGGGGTVLVGGEFQGRGAVPNASQTLVTDGVTINADAIATGNGGRVIVWADQDTQFSGQISARGGATIGNGGFVEVSGKQTLSFNGRVDAAAPNGQAGTLLLDPFDFEINASNVDSINQSTVTTVIQADNNITFSVPVTIPAFGAGLTANAGNNIFVNSNITTNGGDVRLFAGNGVFLNTITINTNPLEDFPGTVSGAIEISGGTQVSVLNSQLLSRGNNDRASFSAIGVVSPRGSVEIDGSLISTTNFGSGFAGDVVVTARDQVSIANTSIFSQGKLGRIFIGEADYQGFDFSPTTIAIANSLLQTSNGLTSSPIADAGNIIIQSSDSVAITDNSEIRSRAVAEKQGNAGGIGIGTGSLLIQNSDLDTSTFSQNSSAFTANNISGNSFSLGSSAGAVLLLAERDIVLDNGDIFNNLENGASGQAGLVLITGKTLKLLNGAQVQTIVRGADENGPAANGTGGNILIGVRDSVQIIGQGPDGFPSAIFSSVGSGSVGRSGNVLIETRALQVRDGATINVDNAGLGLAGNIEISALGVWLDNGANIRASTFIGLGGNIALNVPGAIIIGRDSGIFASTAISPFNGVQGGGNIAVGSGQLREFFAFERGVLFNGLEFDGSTLLVAGKTRRDNNILARGFEAVGGVIRINAFRLQDIAQRPDAGDRNDISTQSFFNIDGLSVVNALNIFPSFRVDPLPERTEVPTIAQGCDPRIRQESSQFVISGRGGLPPSAADNLTPAALVRDDAAVAERSPNNSTTAITPPARGWQQNPDGSIRLVAHVTDPTAPITPSPLWSTPSCYVP